MKHFYFLFFITFCGFSQVPSGYYDDANGKTGYALKTELKKIIDDKDDNLSIEFLSLDLGYGELYTTYETSDIDSYFENNGTVLDMYSEKPLGMDSYEYTYAIETPNDDRDMGSGGNAEGQFYNREHIIPQSVFNQDSPMRNDAHFVVPSDKFVNSQRGSFPFGVVDIPNWTSTNLSKRGNNLNSGYSAGYTGTVFEPIDEFKGDIARMHFYFAVRYEDDITTFNSYDMFDGSENQVFSTTFFNILYQWHINDPVSTREQDRNNAIFNRQNNRNPFIDNPNYVQSIWSSLLSNKNIESVAAKIYPNPVKDNFVYFSTIQNLEAIIYNVIGKQILVKNISKDNNAIDVSNLAKGIYVVKLNSNRGSITKKLIKQ